MIHAYNKLYLNDAQVLLANAFDYAINDCKLSPDWFARLFIRSNIAKEFETGSPAILSGRSGIEIVQDILSKVDPGEVLPQATFSQDRSPEYWAGWALAYYQWYTAKRFKDIFSRVTLTEVLSMYKLFHEMDLTNFVEEMERRCSATVLDTKLKKIRESRVISQHELAVMSGVKLRSIQLYEQKVNNIDKAQAQTLYKLSRVLGCSIEDLLEKPESIE